MSLPLVLAQCFISCPQNAPKHWQISIFTFISPSDRYIYLFPQFEPQHQRCLAGALTQRVLLSVTGVVLISHIKFLTRQPLTIIAADTLKAFPGLFKAWSWYSCLLSLLLFWRRSCSSCSNAFALPAFLI